MPGRFFGGIEMGARDDYDEERDRILSWDYAINAVRERVAAGGKPWIPKPCQCKVCVDERSKHQLEAEGMSLRGKIPGSLR
jgi:hypothetical protein